MSTKLDGMSSLKLTKEEKKNISTLKPRPDIGTVERKLSKLKDL